MRSSTKIKKLMQVLVLGVTVAATIFAFQFFYEMSSTFGYGDLQYGQYPETRQFAEDLIGTLFTLDADATLLDQYGTNILNKRIQLTEIDYELPLSEQMGGSWLTLQKFIENIGYHFYIDEGGSAFECSVEEYNDAWYTIALSGESVAKAKQFYTISHDDYVNLLCMNAEQNALYTDENILTEVESAYIDSNFSSDSYIGYYKDVMYVYSPDEDMFYSSIYGWYSVPDTLYFLAEDVAGDFETVELLLHPFASKEEILRQKIGHDYLDYIQAYQELYYNERNIAYYVVADGKRYTNVGSLDKLVNCNIYLEILPTASGEYTVEFHNFENSYLNDEYITGVMQGMNILKPEDKLYIGIYTTYPYGDRFSQSNKIFKEYYPYTMPALFGAVIMLVLSVILAAYIIRMCGRESKENKEIYLGFLDKIPVEIMVVASVIGIIFLFAVCMDSIFYLSGRLDIFELYVYVISYLLFITGTLSLIRRGKARKFMNRSLIRWLFAMIKRLVTMVSRQKNLRARTIELFLLYWAIMFLGEAVLLFGDQYMYYEFSAFLGILIIAVLNIRVLVLLLRQARGEESIRDATKALADGDFEYQPPAIRRLDTEQEIIDNINHLSDGLQKAVEKSIYDERMKAELITNVSHDIKTPLTSIINYVDLIKRENIEDEKLIHYIEVLDRKSQRLKQLTEDLVEVSKITTGNIELERVPIDFGELLRQSIGEFEDKFTEQELCLVDNITEQSYMIFADGRRTFRILENLFQNIYKYAMPKTRVYIDIENKEGTISLSIKNISKSPLNIDARELIERFVRGDSARTSEGSGLGLSIAQDLVKLQDGEFEIFIDGDLFKVLITFPEFSGSIIIDTDEGTELLEKEEVPAIEGPK